jgi:hypothetical protein
MKENELAKIFSPMKNKNETEMKTKLLLILFVFALTAVVAQTDVEIKKEMKIVVANSAVKDTTIKDYEEDTLHIRLGDFKIDIYPDSTSKLAGGYRKSKYLPLKEFTWYGFSGIRIGFLNFMDSYQNAYDAEWLQNQGKRNSSGSIGMGIINTSFELVQDRFRLGTGLGFSLETIALNRNLRLAEVDTFGFQTGSFPMSNVATLNSIYLTVPFVFQFNAKVTERDREDLWLNEERNIFNVSFGVIGGYRLSSNAIYKWRENGEKRKQRVAGDFGLNEYMLNLYTEVGFTNSLSFFWEAGLLSKFSSGKGPEIYSNTFGLKLNF